MPRDCLARYMYKRLLKNKIDVDSVRSSLNTTVLNTKYSGQWRMNFGPINPFLFGRIEFIYKEINFLIEHT